MKQRAKISESDKEQIERLRVAVKDEITEYYDTDFNLLRWLIGHNYNFDIIIPKLRNHLRFRRSSWDLDKCTEQPRDHTIHRFWKAGITGQALRTPNVIVNIEQTGTNDYWGMLATFPINELMKARVYDLEMMLKKVMEMESETGEQAAILYVMDLNGLNYDKKLLNLLTGALAGISSFMSENYVEMVHSFVLVNAPSFISTIWSIARPLLPERTRNKVQIFGSNWRNDILTLAVPEVLPSYWNDDKNNIFKANVERSELIDPANYYKDGELKNSNMITIAAGKADFVTINAQKGQSLKWLIQCNGNFAYSLYYTENADENDVKSMKSVYPLFTKIPGPIIVPMGEEIYCEQSGAYKFWFSNEHAWLHTLRIRYQITVA